MKNKLVVIPDLHLQIRQPQNLAVKEFIKWFSTQSFNNDTNYFLQLGDFYDKYNPEPSIVDIAIDMFHNKLKFKHNYIIAGNNQHEFNRKNNAYAISSLSSLQNVTCLYDIQRLKIGKLDTLIIPWFYDNKYTDDKGNYLKLKDKLTTDYFDKDLLSESYDYVFAHLNIVDQRSSDYIDLSFINSKNIIAGHLHNEFCGVCISNSFGQDKYDSKVMIIDLITKEVDYISIPKFLIYDSVSYPNEIKCKRELVIDNETYSQYVVYDINDVIDKQLTLNYYNNNEFCFIRELNKKIEKTEVVRNEKTVNEKLSISEWRDRFIEESNIDKDVEKELRSRIK